MESTYQTTGMNLPKRSSQGYIVATTFLTLFGLVGFGYYGLPFFYDFMVKEFGWTRAIVTSGNAIGKLVVGPLFGFIAGWMIDKYGPRRMMLAGAIMMGTAFIGLSHTGGSLVIFYLFYIFNALGYVCGGPIPCQVLISRWFDKNRGKAMGIAYLGIGTGGALVPQIAAGLEKQMGWHSALSSLGFLIFFIALPLTYFIKGSSLKPSEPDQGDYAVPMKRVFTNRYFYLLAIGSMCSIGAVGGVGQHLKLYLRDINYSQAEAANVMSIVLLSSLAGRLLMGTLADIIRRKYVMILIYMIVATAIPLLLVPDFPGRIYIFAVIFGIGLGGDYMIVPLMAGDLFGIRVLGRTMGIILIADVIAESTFPMLVGALYDSAKSYTPGFIILIGVALTGALIISLLPKPDRTRQIREAIETE